MMKKNFQNTQKIFFFQLILLLFILSACAGIKPQLDTIQKWKLPVSTESDWDETSELGTKKESTLPDKYEQEERLLPIEPLPVKDIGASTLLAAEPVSFDSAEDVNVAVDNMELEDFIHYVFGDLLGVNYVLADKLPSKTSVSLNLQQKVSRRQLYETVVDLLGSYKVKVEVKDDVFYIVPGVTDPGLTFGFGGKTTDIPAVDGKIRQLVPLQYTTPQRLMQIISGIPGTTVLAAPGENVLMITGPREGVVKAVEFVSLFDIPALRGKYGATLQLQYRDVDELVKKVREILIEEGIPVAGAPGQGGLMFVSLERWRKILVFSAEQNWIDRVAYWVDMLDVPQEGDGRQFFVYFPENSRAVDLGDTLESILGLSKSVGKTEEGKRSEDKTTSRVSQAKQISSAASLVALGEEVAVTVDEVRNCLVFYTTPVTYKNIVQMLTQLDIMPAQIHIQATLAEVTLKDSLQYGVEWFYKGTSSRGDHNDLTNTLQTLGGLGLGSGGLSYSLVNGSGNFQVFLQALADNELLKILSSPRLTVLDGKSASMVIGTQVPLITSEATTPDVVDDGSSAIIRSVQYQDTGMSLTVTPTVHARGVVSLQIDQTLSEAQTNNLSSIDSPIILNRTVSTEVVTADGQSVLLGGLISDNNSITVNKVPILGDIPYLGNLFKTNSESVNRTELLVLITPRIIRSSLENDDIRSAMIQEFNYLEVEEESEAGGEGTVEGAAD